jgi:hypothetical protein
MPHGADPGGAEAREAYLQGWHSLHAAVCPRSSEDPQHCAALHDRPRSSLGVTLYFKSTGLKVRRMNPQELVAPEEMTAEERAHMDRESSAYATWQKADAANAGLAWQRFSEIHAQRPASLVRRMERERGLR